MAKAMTAAEPNEASTAGDRARSYAARQLLRAQHGRRQWGPLALAGFCIYLSHSGYTRKTQYMGSVAELQRQCDQSAYELERAEERAAHAEARLSEARRRMEAQGAPLGIGLRAPTGNARWQAYVDEVFGSDAEESRSETDASKRPVPMQMV
mmetsp:Transcript_26998/g.65589  ORF Transcript_26998/g.65589 Transcript_26998/m.65589 type:complete len:152 (-) Transcript_26998:49-504(-)